MMSGFGWAALALLFGYLALFFWGSAIAAQAAGKPVWLFARATGRDRLAAFGFRAAFTRDSLASVGASTRRGPARAERTCAGTAIFQRSRMASASAGLLSSATVGPEPIRAGSFPGTSEIIKLSTGAGQAAAASCPPFTRLRCLRTTFICEIGAPEARRPALTACLSAKVSPSVGETISAEAGLADGQASGQLPRRQPRPARGGAPRQSRWLRA